MKVHSNSLSDTMKIGKIVALDLTDGDVIFLTGDLGSGKTFFTKALSMGLGVSESSVTSPTFSLIQEYQGEHFKIYHGDFYRLKEFNEVESTGILDWIEKEGITILEWAEEYNHLLVENCLIIRIESNLGENDRILNFISRGLNWEKRVEKWKKQLF